MTVPGVARGELRATYDAVVIGGGIQGLAVAYELAKRRFGRICVAEAGYPGVGASGRNGELIRSAFESAAWVGLFDRSLQRWGTLAQDLGASTLFTRAGYLVVADTEAQATMAEHAVRRHAALGLRTRLLDTSEVLTLVPALAPGIVRAGIHQPDAGFAHHDASVWAYVRGAARAGVEVHPQTCVTGIRLERDRVTGVRTSRGDIATPLVVDAAGGRAREVAAMARVLLPTKTERLEALVTESVRPFLRPGVALLDVLGYCHQTTRGEFVGGTEVRGDVPPDSMRTSLTGLRDAAAKFTRAFPVLRGVRVIRQWAGLVDATPDYAPILGPVPGTVGLWLDCGWTYGFMGAPAAGELLAEAITTGRLPSLIAPFGLDRFAAGRLIAEGSLVVAGPGG